MALGCRFERAMNMTSKPMPRPATPQSQEDKSPLKEARTKRMQYGAWYRKAEKVRWCLHPLSCLWNCSGCRTAKRHAAKAEFVFAYAFYVCFCVCFLCVVFSGVKSRRRISRAPANDKAPSSTQQPVHLPFLLVQIDSAQFHCQHSAMFCFLHVLPGHHRSGTN